MVQSAEIRGSGIAAEACCAILRRFGWNVNTPVQGKAAVPYLVINSVTAALIKDVFGAHPERLRGHQISRRLVANHLKSTILQVTESAQVIDGDTLGSLRAASVQSSRISCGDVPWRLFAGESPPEGQLVTFGNRTAWIFHAKLHTGFNSDVAIFEFIPEGWLFWAPFSSKKGFIQLALPQFEEDTSKENPSKACYSALKRTRILKDAVMLDECIAGPIPCTAALHSQPTGTNWIATGTSALRYDPISGNGTGASIRSAILACATLRAIAGMADPELYLDYYRRRIVKAFDQHLEICESLYERAGLSVARNDEISYVRRYHYHENAASAMHRTNFYLRDYRVISL